MNARIGRLFLLPLFLLGAFVFLPRAEVVSAQEAAAEIPRLPDGRVFTLLYNANTWGNYSPCKVCGGRKLGGLPKRATIFKAMRSAYAGRGLAFLAGPYELTGLHLGTVPGNDMAGPMSGAYNLLNYDLMAVDQPSEQWLRDNQAVLPSSAVAVTDKYSVSVMERDGSRIGVVVLPEAKEPWRSPVLKQLSDLSAQLRPKVDLVVAISPWGEKVEEQFLKEAGPLFDVLLGSGEGFPGLHRMSPDGRTLWLRPPALGKVISLVHVKQWPVYTDGQLKAGEYAIDQFLLGETLEDDPQVAELLDHATP